MRLKVVTLALCVWIGGSAVAGIARTGGSGGVLDTPALGRVNERLPDWIELGGAVRFRFEGRRHLGFADGNDDAYGLVRTRVNVRLRPSERIELFVQAQDARAPGMRPGTASGVFRDPLDLRQAWIGFGTLEDDGFRLTAGRQLLLFGDQRLVGPLDWTNTARTWDAIRLDLAPTAGVDVALVSSSVVRTDPERRINHAADGQNLHGVYARIDGAGLRGTLEPFVFWRTMPRVVDEDGEVGDMDRYSAGVRVFAPDLGGLDYSVTLVRQWGHHAGAAISAWASSIGLGYTFSSGPDVRAYAEYNFATGDSAPTDNRIGGFDDVYPTAHLYYGYNDLVGWRNLHNLRVGTTLTPVGRLAFRIDHHTFWRAEPNDGLYTPSGALSVAAPVGGAIGRRIGQEVDVTVTHPLTPTVAASGGIGHMFPGPFLEARTPGESHTFVFLALGVEF